MSDTILSNETLAMLGHRNWIAIVDSAYPSQTALGIELKLSSLSHIEVVEQVLLQISACRHIRPEVFLDAELKHLLEWNESDFTLFRQDLQNSLQNYQPTTIPHDEILSMLSEAGKEFRIIIIKTCGTVPYSSVFIRLACGYWSADQEAKLRSKIARNVQETKAAKL